MQARWPEAAARRIGLRGAIDFTPTRVGLTLHVPCARKHVVDVTVKQGSHPDHVAKTMLAKGWTFGRHLLCPEHRRKEKIKPARPAETSQGEPVTMPELSATQPAVTPPIATKPEPSEAARKAKRLVYQALEDYYDDSRKSYRPGRSDASIAKELGVAPDVVKSIREESFGPIAEPSELAALREEAAAIRAEFTEYARLAQQRFDAITRKINDTCQRNGWHVSA